MEVKEDVYKDVQEIFGRIIFWKNFWNKNLRLAYHLCPNILDFFWKKNTQIFMGNFFLYKVPCFVKNLKGKNHTYYYTFPRFNLAKRVNPPITKIGHVLKNVFFLSYFSAQHKDVGVLFCKYFMTFLIICPVANAISLNWIPRENGHFFKQFSQVVVYFTLVGRGVRWFPKEFWWVYQTHNNSSYTLIFSVKWCCVLLI